MIGWLIALGYVAGWLAAARVAARELHTYGDCHGESKYGGSDYTYRSICRSYHKPGCWRPSEGRISFVRATQASGLALIWPLAAIPYFVMTSVRPIPRPFADRIAELEKELGMN